MSRKHIDPEQVYSQCCWCGRPIPNETEFFGLGGRAHAGIDLSAYEGAALEIVSQTSGRKFFAIVPSSDSDARKDGDDLMFVVCSRECGSELKSALNHEIALGDVLGDIHDMGE